MKRSLAGEVAPGISRKAYSRLPRTLLGLALLFSPACAPGHDTPSQAVSKFDSLPGVTDVCSILMSPGPPPAPPQIKPEGQSVRVLAFGDFGDGQDDQRAAAAAMVRYDRSHSLDFGLTLGDNFYEHGLNKPDHPRWRTNWDNLYDPLGIRVYATFGNHDYENLKSLDAEVRRSTQDRSWCLPRPYYTFTAGPVQFFAIDTTPLDKPHLDGKGPTKVSAQREWLEKALASSTARWKVVYGHHPVYSTGTEHGDTPAMIREVLPLLKKHHVDVYLSGHDHDMEYLRPEDDVHFFVSGAGGHHLREMGTATGRRKWAVGLTPGFAVLEVDQDLLAVSFFCARGSESPLPQCRADNQAPPQLCKVKIRKGQPDDDSECRP
jgi:tartrate-resistant acid phosphatase type 5